MISILRDLIYVSKLFCELIKYDDVLMIFHASSCPKQSFHINIYLTIKAQHPNARVMDGNLMNCMGAKHICFVKMYRGYLSPKLRPRILSVPYPFDIQGLYYAGCVSMMGREK